MASSRCQKELLKNFQYKHLQRWHGRVLTLQKSFSDQTFYVTITNADMRSQKVLHTLFNKCSDHMPVKFEQNRTVKNMKNFELFGKKWLTIFEKNDAIWEDVYVI